MPRVNSSAEMLAGEKENWGCRRKRTREGQVRRGPKMSARLVRDCDFSGTSLRLSYTRLMKSMMMKRDAGKDELCWDVAGKLCL